MAILLNLVNLVRDLDDHDLSVLHTQNTQNGLVGVACVNPLPKKFRARAGHAARMDDERLPDTILLSQLEHGDRIELRSPPEVGMKRNVDPITCILICS